MLVLFSQVALLQGSTIIPRTGPKKNRAILFGVATLLPFYLASGAGGNGTTIACDVTVEQ